MQSDRVTKSYSVFFMHSARCRIAKRVRVHTKVDAKHRGGREGTQGEGGAGVMDGSG